MDLQQARESLAPVWGRSWTLHVQRGEGAYLFDVDGRRYLDFTCGIGVTNTGHCHPTVVAAAQAQTAQLIHGQANIVYHEPMLRLASTLKTVLPPTLDTFFFANSGAEAIEASVKLARQVTKRTNIVVFAGSFHGRTIGAMSLTTSKTAYRAGYQPLMPGVFVAPFPYRYYYGWSEAETVQFCLRELEHLLHTQSAPEETAALLIEPVLGEGGYVPAPPAFIQGLRAICDRHGILLIADEVQTGFGRTGTFWAMDQMGVEPDVVVMAKGLASGFPLSGIAARRDLMARWPPNTHGGTYGGNAVACAAAAATIDVLREEGLVANSAARGRQLIDGLRQLQERYSLIGDVRGLGCMVAVECTGAAGEPDGAAAKTLAQGCFNAGLLLLTCGAYGQVLRWIPPLIASREQIDEGLQIFAHVLEQSAAGIPAAVA
jgi:4-aminobutyrate aminotransferase